MAREEDICHWFGLSLNTYFSFLGFIELIQGVEEASTISQVVDWNFNSSVSYMKVPIFVFVKERISSFGVKEWWSGSVLRLQEDPNTAFTKVLQEKSIDAGHLGKFLYLLYRTVRWCHQNGLSDFIRNVVQTWQHLNAQNKVGKTTKMGHKDGTVIRMFSHGGNFDGGQTIMEQSTKVLNSVLNQKL